MVVSPQSIFGSQSRLLPTTVLICTYCVQCFRVILCSPACTYNTMRLCPASFTTLCSRYRHVGCEMQMVVVSGGTISIRTSVPPCAVYTVDYILYTVERAPSSRWSLHVPHFSRPISKIGRGQIRHVVIPVYYLISLCANEEKRYRKLSERMKSQSQRRFLCAAVFFFFFFFFLRPSKRKKNPKPTRKCDVK